MGRDRSSRAARRTPRGRGAVLAGLAAAAALSAGPAPASPYGVNAHVPSPAVLDAIAAGGIRWVRVDFLWSWVEPEQDRFDWSVYDEVVDAALARGLSVYATVGDTPAWATDGPPGRGAPRRWADWYDVCYRAASRYRGRVDHWGMWNEPNVARFWAGTRDEYIEGILGVGAAAVHAASPTARACGPELAHLQSARWDSWLRDVLARAAGELDVVTHHIYPDGTSARSVADLLARGSSYPWDPPSVREVLRDGGWLGRPFWLTETGCSSGGSASGEQAQAAFVTGLAAALLGPARVAAWVHKVFFYEIADDPRFPQSPLGLLGPPPEYRRKSAYGELGRVSSELAVDDAEFARVDVPEWLPGGGTAVARVIVRNTGTTVWSSEAGYRLAATDASAPLAATRQDLPPGTTVVPGATVELSFEIGVPALATRPGEPEVGEWQMIREGKWRFGESAAVAIAVGDDGTRHARVVPFAGRAAGGAWASELVLHNGAPTPLPVVVSLLAGGEDNRHPRRASLDLAPGATVRVADLLAARFGAGGRGALRVEAASARLAAAAAPSVDAAAGAAASLLPGLGADAAVTAGGEGYLLRLARAAEEGGARTDLVLHNPGPAPAAAAVEVLGDDGRAAATTAYELPPFAVRVVDDVLGGAGIEAAARARLRVLPTPGGGGVHAWALVRGGGDPQAVAAVPAGDEPVVLAPLQGGSRLRGGAWRADLELLNPDAAPALVTVALLAPVSQPARRLEVDLAIAGDGHLVVEDALAALFGFRGSGALLVTPRSGRVAVAAGSALARAPLRSGRTAAALPLSRATGDGGECRLLPVARERRAGGARTHAGLANPGSAPLEVRAQVLDATGRLLRAFPIYLSPREFRQMTDVLQVAPALDGGDAVIALQPRTPGGRLVAWAVVERGSGGGTLHVPCL